MAMDREERSEVMRNDYMAMACAGGYRDAVARSERTRRRAWFDNYVRRIVQRDAADISGLRHVGELPVLLRLIAAHSASVVSRAALARAAGMKETTIPPYLELLETLYLVHRIPAWSNNHARRVARAPKLAVLDSGLAARLLNLDPAGLAADLNPDPAGALIETFVLSELRKLLPYSTAQPEMFHFRHLDGAEVDVVLEHGGRVVCIEVKASSSIDGRAFRWLSKLRDQIGPRFAAGVVLYTGRDALPWGDRLAAWPISTLWLG